MEEQYEEWKRTGSPDATDKLLQAADPTLSSALKSWAGGDESLRGRAKVMAMKAFDSFDASKGAKLQTHVMNTLRPLSREYSRRRQVVNVPDKIVYDQYRLSQSTKELSDSLGYEPDAVTLADHSGIPLKRIERIRKYGNGEITESALSEAAGDDDDDSPYMPGVMRSDPEHIWMEYVHHDLGPMDRKILEWRTGMFGAPKLQNQEIAARLGVTPGAVSQRVSKIQARIAEGRQVKGL